MSEVIAVAKILENIDFVMENNFDAGDVAQYLLENYEQTQAIVIASEAMKIFTDQGRSDIAKYWEDILNGVRG